jgi:hypothetical protein
MQYQNFSLTDNEKKNQSNEFIQTCKTTINSDILDKHNNLKFIICHALVHDANNEKYQAFRNYCMAIKIIENFNDSDLRSLYFLIVNRKKELLKYMFFDT